MKTKTASLRKRLVQFLLDQDLSETDIFIIHNREEKRLAGLDPKANIHAVKTIHMFGTEFVTESVINRMIFRMVKGLYPSEKELYLMRVFYFAAVHKWIQKRPGIESTYPRLIRMLAFWEFISTHNLNEKEAMDLFATVGQGMTPNYDHERLNGFDKLKQTWKDNLWMQL